MAITISELPAGSNPIGTEIAPFVQGGQTVSLSVDQVISLVTLAGLGGITAAQAITLIDATVNQVYIGSNLYPETPAETTAGATPVSDYYPPYTSFRYMTVFQIADVATGTPALDMAGPLTTLFNILQANGGIVAYVNPGVYGISTLNMSKNGRYIFDGVTLQALSTSSQACLVKFTAAYSTVYDLQLDCRWKSNYACALHWTSASVGAPSQSNNFFGGFCTNALMGVLFGELTSPITTAQSENYWHGFHTRGIQNVIQMNQPNGFVCFVGSELASSKNEWDINNPGVYSFTTANVATMTQGVLRLVGCDLEKTESALGNGFLLNAAGAGSASLEIGDCDMEIACLVFNHQGGTLDVRGIGGQYWNNGTTPYLQLSGSAGGVARIVDFTLNKDPSQSGANQAFLDCGATTGQWDVTLTNLRLENQLQLVYWNGNSSPTGWAQNVNLRMSNVKSVNANGGSNAPAFPDVSTSTYNLLDAIGTDNIGNDIGTWYKEDFSGSGAIALNADVPGGSTYLNSVQVTPAASDASGVYTIDFTSLTTVKAKGIKCKPGDGLMMSGWFRMASAGTGQVNAVFADSTGASHATSNLFDNTNLLTNSWQFLTCLFKAGTGSYYAGVGVQGTGGTVARTIGCKVDRLTLVST